MKHELNDNEFLNDTFKLIEKMYFETLPFLGSFNQVQRDIFKAAHLGRTLQAAGKMMEENATRIKYD